MRPKSASSQRAKAEAAHRKVMARREAESTVRASYFRFAGNSDVASFMRGGWAMTYWPARMPACLPSSTLLFRSETKSSETSQPQECSSRT